MPETVIFILLAGFIVKGLFTALARRPGSERVLMGGCGLFLAVYMTITGICMLAEPELDSGFGLTFFLWAGSGVVILVTAVKGR